MYFLNYKISTGCNSWSNLIHQYAIKIRDKLVIIYKHSTDTTDEFEFNKTIKDINRYVFDSYNFYRWRTQRSFIPCYILDWIVSILILRTMVHIGLLRPLFHLTTFGRRKEYRRIIWLVEGKAQGTVIVSNSIDPKRNAARYYR